MFGDTPILGHLYMCSLQTLLGKLTKLKPFAAEELYKFFL